ASRIGCTKPASHCEPKPAPPSSVLFVIHSLFCKSSAIVIFHDCVERISLLIHCSRLQPSGKSGPLTLRMLLTESKRRPSIRYLFSQKRALSRRYWRTSGRP